MDGDGYPARTVSSNDHWGKSAFSGKRPVSFDGKFRAAPTYRRAELLAGNKISGPALIEEHASTTVLMPRDRMTVDAWGNLVIKVAGAK